MKRTKGSIEKGNGEEKLFGYRRSGFFLGLSLNPPFSSFAVLIAAAMCIGIVNQCEYAYGCRLHGHLQSFVTTNIYKVEATDDYPGH
jgi:hypothetical protein